MLIPAGIGLSEVPEGIKAMRVRVREIYRKLGRISVYRQAEEGARTAQYQAALAEGAAKGKSQYDMARRVYESRLADYTARKAAYDAQVAKMAGKSQEEILAAAGEAPVQPMWNAPALSVQPPSLSASNMPSNPAVAKEAEGLIAEFRRQVATYHRRDAVDTLEKIAGMAEALPPQTLSMLQDEIKTAFPAMIGETSDAGPPSDPLKEGVGAGAAIPLPPS